MDVVDVAGLGVDVMEPEFEVVPGGVWLELDGVFWKMFCFKVVSFAKWILQTPTVEFLVETWSII